jgi:alpha-glucosidase (family GH31 glycosyl hydrolase)
LTRNVYLLFAALCGVAWTAASDYQPLESCTAFHAGTTTVTFQCAGGAAVAVRVITPEILRVRVSPDGRFPDSLPTQWGFVKDNWPRAPFTTRQTAENVWIETSSLRVKVTKRPFRLSVEDHAGKVLWREQSAPELSAGTGARLRVEMHPDDHFYGLGFQRVALDLRGKRLSWHRGFRWKEATVPFFMSTRGYAFYSNNTWDHTFDFTQPGGYSIAAAGGQLDYYIFYGPGMKRLLDRYTDLTGKPLHAPRWAFGLGYQCRYFVEQNQVMSIAERFRKEDIPLDMMGLEPGWEDEPYRMGWNWSPTRFPHPAEMVRNLDKMGIKFEMWESGNAPPENYTDPEARKRWFAKRVAASLGIGVRWFKQDDPYPRMIFSEELATPDVHDGLKDSGGRPAAELRNLSNSLYSETVFNEMRRITGQRSMVMFNSYGSSIASHRWPFTWGADYVAGVGSLNAGLSAHSMISVSVDNEHLGVAGAPASEKGSPTIHVGHLLPFAYIESWAYYKEPWHYSETLLEANRFYTKLRYRLIPYLYCSAHQAATNGTPMMRAMVLEYQNDPRTYDLTSQFMLGDWLLVGQPRPNIYLPAGEWTDFWTGEVRSSKGEWQNCNWPETVGGPLFVKGGAIVPMGPVMSYSDQEPLEVVTLDVYPHGESRYRMYEDDGVTYDYQSGAYASTEFHASQSAGSVTIGIGPRKGAYKGMPQHRAYLLSVHLPHAPVAVSAGGHVLRQRSDKGTLLYAAGASGWSYDQMRRILWVKPTTGWRYDYDQRGASVDHERDTAYWDSAAEDGARGGLVRISLSAASPLAARPVAAAAAVPPDEQVDLKAVKATFELKASPPERVKLRDGSWLPYRVTIYATLRADGQRIRNANNLVRLHVAGPGSKLPPDRQVRAVHGIAVFEDVIVQPPAKYTFHVTGEGVEEARIPIY